MILFGSSGNCFILGDMIEANPQARRVPIEAAKEIAEKINAITYLESSSKTGKNIQEIFQQIIAKHVQLVSTSDQTKSVTNDHSIDLSNRETSSKKSSCC